MFIRAAWQNRNYDLTVLFSNSKLQFCGTYLDKQKLNSHLKKSFCYRSKTLCGHKHARCHIHLDFIITFGQNTKKTHQGSSPDSNFLQVEEYWNSVDLHLPLIFKPLFPTLHSLGRKKKLYFLVRLASDLQISTLQCIIIYCLSNFHCLPP